MSKGLKYTFLVHAIVAVIIGLGLVLVAQWFLDLVNWTPSDPTMARAYGAALLAIGVSSWLGYMATEWKQVRIVVRMENVLTIVGFLESLYSVLFADGPAFVWSNVAITGIFGILFIYFGRPAKA
jgi:hypothetical protein